MNATRWRSCLMTVSVLLIAGGSVAPLLYSKCGWPNIPSLKIWNHFANFFYLPVGILIYLLASVLVLISFARRIRQYGTENNSRMKTFRKLLRTHWFVFLPPLAAAICTTPYIMAISIRKSGQSYFPCDISALNFGIKVLLEVMAGVPFAITWLLYVYPSRVYMTEFYLNTWSGQSLATIFFIFQPYNDRKESDHYPATNFRNNERDDRDAFIKVKLDRSTFHRPRY